MPQNWKVIASLTNSGGVNIFKEDGKPNTYDLTLSGLDQEGFGLSWNKHK